MPVFPGHCTSFYPTPGTVPSWACPPPSVTSKTVAVSPGPPSTPTGVCVFLHPTQALNLALPLTVPGWVTAPGGVGVQNLATAIASSGWATLYPVIPCDFSQSGVGTSNLSPFSNDVANDSSGHGTIYVNEVLAWWDHMLEYIYLTYGHVPVVIGGFSLGSWHALVIANNRPSGLVGFFGMCIPTTWQSIGISNNPFAPLGSSGCAGINLGTTYLSGCTLTGWIGWNTNDTTVGFSVSSTPPSNCQAIAASAGGTITTYQSTLGGPGQGHLFTSSEAAQVATWFGGV